MRKLLYILGAVALVAILAAGMGVGVFIYKARALDAESKAFADSAIQAIAMTWSKQQFLDRAAPELRNRVRLDELNRLFDQFAKLGSLVEYQGAEGQANISYMMGAGGAVSAVYVGRARCENGDVTIQIGLLKRGDGWTIGDFRVDSVPGSQVRPGA